MERDYVLKRQKWRARFEKAALSSAPGQQCQPESDIVGLASRQGSPSHSDNSVTQTSPINSIPKTSPSNSITSTLAAPPSNRRLTPENETKLCREERKREVESRHQAVRANSAQLAWEAAATRRWNADLRSRFASPLSYGAVVDAIDNSIQAGATETEMKRTGGGIEFIIDELARRGVLEGS